MNIRPEYDTAPSLRKALADTLAEVRNQPQDALLNARYQRLMAYGRYKQDK